MKKAVKDILHAIINVQSRILIAELPGDDVKYIEKNSVKLGQNDFC